MPIQTFFSSQAVPRPFGRLTSRLFYRLDPEDAVVALASVAPPVPVIGQNVKRAIGPDDGVAQASEPAASPPAGEPSLD